MDAALIAAATVLGLGGVPHCAAMCAGPCTALGAGRSRGALLAFQAGRLVGYAAAGAVAAGSVASLAQWAQLVPALRPMWTLLQLAMLALGLWMLVAGRQPAWRLGRAPQPALGGGAGQGGGGDAGGWAPVAGPRSTLLRTGAAGLAWVAWPCGLLQSALLLASLTGSGWSGAVAMAGFALGSGAGLVLAPALWRWLRQRGSGWEQGLVRMAGAMLAVGAAFALGHGLWAPFAAWCGLA